MAFDVPGAPGGGGRSTQSTVDPILVGQVYAAALDVPTTELAEENVREIHLHL